MKGFLVLAFNEDFKDQVDYDNLESELSRKRICYTKATPSCNIFDHALGYQFFKDEVEPIETNHYVAGDYFGDFESGGKCSLSYRDTLNLLDDQNLEDTAVNSLEGNGIHCSVLSDCVVFQNDAEGYKRLFYYHTSSILCVTNNLPLLLVTINKKWVVRKNAILSYLLQRESKWPLTFIDDVYVLPPLSKAKIDSSGIKISSTTFSKFYDLKPESKADIRNMLLARYKLNVNRKFTDKTAVTLSGGYDSNCLTKLFNMEFGKGFTAVSVGYVSQRKQDTNVYDETVYAERIANKLGIPFKRYLVDKDTFFSYLDEFIESLDQPGHDPSSNFILNRLLVKDGFNVVVNGMGGDACFTSKTRLHVIRKVFQLSKKINFIRPFNTISKRLGYRGPLKYVLASQIPNKPHEDFASLYQAQKLFSTPIHKYVSSDSIKSLDEENLRRQDYYASMVKKAKTEHEIYYSLALFSNPDEYHASLMAERNNIEILMPFVDTKAVSMVLNGSKFWKINNREFEMSVFGGIDQELLLKAKSGFSIPYSEWMQPFAKSTLDFFSELGIFNEEDFALEAFMHRYFRDQNFATSMVANQVIWKLLIVKKYVQRYNLHMK